MRIKLQETINMWVAGTVVDVHSWSHGPAGASSLFRAVLWSCSSARRLPQRASSWRTDGEKQPCSCSRALCEPTHVPLCRVEIPFSFDTDSEFEWITLRPEFNQEKQSLADAVIHHGRGAVREESVGLSIAI